MKIQTVIFSLFWILFFSCGEKENPGSGIGTVKITAIKLQEAANPAGRINAVYQWKHLFTEQLQLKFTSSDGDSFSLTINPNDLTQANSIELPFGNYEYSGTSTAQEISETLPIRVTGQVTVNSSSKDLSIIASSDYGLITLSKSNLSAAPKTLEPQTGSFASTSDFFYLYIKNDLTLNAEIPLSSEHSFRLVDTAKSFTHQHFQLLDESVDTPDSFEFTDFALAIRRLNLGANGFPEVLFPYQINDLEPSLEETSGLQLIEGRLFSINDGGNSAEIQEINPESGALIRKIKVSNAPNVDWEDLAASTTHLYIGDFGNNEGKRTDLKILKIPISSVLGENEVTAEVISFSYPDQSDFSGTNPDHNFDCEAMVFWNNQLHLFSKNRGDSKTKHYSLTTAGGNQVAVLLESFDSEGLITAADVSPDGKNIVLLGYEDKGASSRAFLWTFANVSGSVFSVPGNRFFLGSPAGLGQTEGISIDAAMEVTISGEQIRVGGLTVPPKIFKVDLAGVFIP